MLQNASKFLEAASHFKEHECYTRLPKNSKSFINFWKQERERCLNGFTSEDGDYISGYFYFYLNYCPIYITVPALDADGNKIISEDGILKGKRVREFPKFWDGDWQYFNYLEEAEQRGQHGVVLKTRGRGYSFKGASMLNRNYFLIPGSKSFAIADQNAFLGGEDGILSKAWEQLSFIDQHTAWSKKRHFHDTDMHKRASYKRTVQGVAQEKGYMSDIIGVSLKNDPDKARGKRGKLILFEEAGKMPALLQAWQVARPSMEQGKTTFGLMVGFGTGGTSEANFDGLNELFYNPKGYNILAINNTWDDNAEGSKCGFFMPEYLNLEGHYDNNGNSNIETAKKEIQQERKIVLDHTKDRSAYRRYCAERPITPIEATMKLRGNLFPTIDLLATLAKLESDPNYEKTVFKGKFELDDLGEISFKEDPLSRIIYNFPHKKEDHTDGPVILYAAPIRSMDDTIPNNLYIAGIDPYDHDKSGTTSLGSCLIINKLNNQIVAEYTARPETAKEYYEQVRRMLIYYNAKALYENEKKGIFDYFESKSSLYLLCPEPLLLKDIIKNPSPSRKFGLKMSENIKRYGEELINQWLLGIDDTENLSMTLQKIRSQALLKELAQYDPDPRKNYDRCIALMCAIYQLNEERMITPIIEESRKTISVNQRGFFSKMTHNNIIHK